MKTGSIISMIVGPILALVTFFASYYLDPLQLGRQDIGSAIPAFLLSIIILLISQIINTHVEVSRATDDANRVYDAVRNHLSVIRIGPPLLAWNYIMKQLPELDCVQNTSFNYEAELERTKERLYTRETYANSFSKISEYVKAGLIWKDLGDETALDRFKELEGKIRADSKGKYEFRRIANQYPQIGFIILTYKNGDNEVLFNWDFHEQNIAQDPKVLLSRDDDIVRMFASHYQNLWDKASPSDYDSIATKSTSKK